MTPLALQYAQEAARRHSTTVEAIFGPRGDHAASAARRLVWGWMADAGQTPSQIAHATGHDRKSVVNGLGIPPKWPSAKPAQCVDNEARRAVEAAAAAMLAKHQRELASRY